MNVLIIEDEAPAARRLATLITRCEPRVQILEILDSVKKSLHWLGTYPEPDLIFSDIQLSDDLSFEIFRQLDLKSPIIFTTAYDEYAIRAFKLHSIDYLLKPIKEYELLQSLHKFERLQQQFASADYSHLLDHLSQKEYRSRFLVYQADSLIPIPSEEIAYFYSEEGSTLLKTHAGKSFTLNEPLDFLENQLDPKVFYRANRQFILSIKAIDLIKQYFKQKLLVTVSPAIDKQILISKQKSSQFKQWLNS
ncbi:MAG: LytTR family DNA-binding domain-containing protein [Microscillaceae bacterium]|nr:LytTR family DNA-binding domain-containing protein [Microscillaceae bacterium]